MKIETYMSQFNQETKKKGCMHNPSQFGNRSYYISYNTISNNNIENLAHQRKRKQNHNKSSIFGKPIVQIRSH